MTTLGLILFIIACFLSAIASGIAFYFDDKKKKEQKDKIKRLEEQVECLTGEICYLKDIFNYWLLTDTEKLKKEKKEQ